MSFAELNPVHAPSPELFCVEVCRNVAPLPLALHALPQPPLLCFAHEYDSPEPVAPTVNVAVVPLQFVVLAGCAVIVGATSSDTVTLDCAVQPNESVTVTVYVAVLPGDATGFEIEVLLKPVAGLQLNV
jgi:hypothetical protein